MKSDFFENSIKSIELGVEDYLSSDPRRPISAVRNFYAGILLLLKERLHRASPELIYKRVQPSRDGSTVKWTGSGKNTVGIQEIKERWQSLGWKANWWKKLKNLKQIRDNIEHRSSNASTQVIRQALNDTFVIVAAVLTDHLNDSPAERFEQKVWATMLSEAETHRALFETCSQSRRQVGRIDSPKARAFVKEDCVCPQCDSELMRALNDVPYPDTEFRCEACGSVSSSQEVVLYAIERESARESYSSFKDFDGFSYGTCPVCGEEAYSIEEDVCLLCEETRPYQNCLRCNAELSLDEQDLDGVCSYCDHVFSKDD